MQKVLVVGGGGRCHAIVEVLARSPFVGKIYCAPGNAGISERAECIPIGDTEVDKLVFFAKYNEVDLTIVGPEASLAMGITDRFREEGLKIFGPTKSAARIESSKEFAKELMAKYSIPTAEYHSFTDYNDAREYVYAHSFPIVLKYDGLAAGKGVVIAENMEQAEDALKDMLVDGKFGKGKVVVEEFLEGPEFSFMCFVAGDKVTSMPLAQDHKRAFEGDAGPNTGGMGAYTPLSFVDESDLKYALDNIMIPTAHAMVAEGVLFTGILYGGLIKTADGIKVIEFNARFGDPETEIVLPLLKSDALELFAAFADGHGADAEWNNKYRLGIVLASKGYPGDYEKGHIIKGLDKASKIADIYHMGTALKDGNIVTSGGRVLMVVGEGDSADEARRIAMEAIAHIHCDNLFWRNDIGLRWIK